jgi:LuxR family maltose regulon positive regulatory protein
MSTPAGKVLPPALPAAWVDRPRLRSRLAEARGRRLTVVVAGAGFGKSSLLAAWVSGGLEGSEAAGGPGGSGARPGPGDQETQQGRALAPRTMPPGGARSAWYSVRPEDRSLPTLLRGLVDALWLRLPGLPVDVSAVLAG